MTQRYTVMDIDYRMGEEAEVVFTLEYEHGAGPILDVRVDCVTGKRYIVIHDVHGDINVRSTNGIHRVLGEQSYEASFGRPIVVDGNRDGKETEIVVLTRKGAPTPKLIS